MKLTELIARLQALQQDHGDRAVMVLDGFNGGGVPRAINLGPTLRVVATADAEVTADCEEIVAEKVVILGFGCY